MENDTQEHGVEFIELKRELQAFQQRRISGTYEDLKGNAEYEGIGDFFFNKLYAPEDFSFRDQSIKTLQKYLKGVVYSGMVSAVGMVIELHELSDRLDESMVEKMIENGVTPSFSMDQYQENYRLLDNYDERVCQIDLAVKVTEAFHRLSKMWIVAVSLKTVRAASHMIGIGKIMDFVHEGYLAFKTIDNIRFFMDTVRERELAWHNEIWKEKRGNAGGEN